MWPASISTGTGRNRAACPQAASADIAALAAG